MKSIDFFKRRFVRWGQIFVSCLMLSFGTSLYAASSQNLAGYILHVEMTPAVCALDSSRQKQRKCLEGYSLTISSLLPEVPVNRNCETKSSATLSPLQFTVVARVMPNETERVQLWQNVGGCVPMNASQYFRTIINFAERLKIPTDLTSQNTITVQKESLRQQFTKLNPSLPANGIRFSCQSSRSDSILTEIRVCYHKNGQYKQCASHVVTGCPSEFTIKGSY